MGEEAPVVAGPFGNKQLIIIATVVAVVIFIIMLVGLRACSAKPAGNDYTVIYSNLELKDTAEVIARLKELKIPYRVKDKGRSIAVPKDKSDEARLGLAEEDLPMGGTVGWEIFDQAKLGATDFDRRIQFIRAISGELSRTINRINAIEDSRVQIVIPETRLFEAAVAPVTASVLLKIKKGEKLSSKQISGIVYFVSSSVENLKRENVTIIDINGNILSSGGYTLLPTEEKEEEKEKEEKPLTGEELIAQVKVKKALEEELASKAQSLINRMYPPNAVLIKINLESLPDKKTTAVVLIDEDINVSRKLKQDTFETVGAVIGYNKERGDKIIMKRAPFRKTAAVTEFEKKKAPEKPEEKAPVAKPKEKVEKKEGAIAQIIKRFGAWRFIVGFILVTIFVVFFVMPALKKRKMTTEPEKGEVEPVKEEVVETEEKPEAAIGKFDSIKEQIANDPEKTARMIVTWVREEAG